MVRYGPKSDWALNVLAAETVALRVDGEVSSLFSPRLVSQKEALDALISDEPPGDFTKADDFVLMDYQT